MGVKSAVLRLSIEPIYSVSLWPCFLCFSCFLCLCSTSVSFVRASQRKPSSPQQTYAISCRNSCCFSLPLATAGIPTSTTLATTATTGPPSSTLATPTTRATLTSTRATATPTTTTATMVSLCVLLLFPQNERFFFSYFYF